MQINSRIPATKPQPVVVMGAAISALTAIVSGLVVIFNDNPTVMLWLGVVGVVVAGAGVFKDQIVKGQVVPYDDVVAYANDERQIVTGPASLGEDGVVVTSVETNGNQ